MPKNNAASGGKKARWTRTQKTEARRSEVRRPSAERGRPARRDRFDGDRDNRGYDRGPRRFEGDDTRGSDRRDDRRDDRGGRSFDRRDDNRGGRSFDRDNSRDNRGGGYNRDNRGGGYNRDDRRDDRGGRSFDRDNSRDNRGGGYNRDNRGGGFNRDDRRDDRGGRGFERRDDRGGRSFDRDNNRDSNRGGGYNRDNRGGGFNRDDRRDDRGGRGFARRDDRGGRPFDRDNNRDSNRGGGYNRDNRGGGGYNRDDRRDDRGGRSFDRRDDRGGRGFDRRDDRGGRNFDRRDNRGPRHEAESAVDGGFERDLEPTNEAFGWTERTDVEEVASDQPITLEGNGFADLGLPEVLVSRLARDGIDQPFPIQTATIPDALAGKDVLGRGRTGSGKTLAFGLPALTRLAKGGKARANQPRSIVMVPTRELAMQVSDALQPLVHVIGLRHKLVAGGMPYEPQLQALERGVDMLIATPGRLKDLIDRGAADLSRVEIMVLDEADHMAEMGFLEAISEILDLVPADGQRLLFSATLDRGIDSVVEKYLTDPVIHSTDDSTAAVTTMSHHALLINPQDKKVVTAEVANREGRTVVFARTKLGADRVAGELRENGVLAAALHGGLNQSQRNRVLTAFREGRVPVLVATDVAARGIHVDDVGVVMQIDPPADHKDYLHRAGRTARAGEEGVVVSLVLPHQRRTMQRLLKDAGVDVELQRAQPGDEVIANTGGSTPQGAPISDDDLQNILSPNRGRNGRRGGGRPYGGGGRRDGGGYGGGHGGGHGGRRDGGGYGRRDGGRREGGPSRRERY